MGLSSKNTFAINSVEFKRAIETPNTLHEPSKSIVGIDISETLFNFIVLAL